MLLTPVKLTCSVCWTLDVIAQVCWRSDYLLDGQQTQGLENTSTAYAK